jgi:hypothetical protein
MISTDDAVILQHLVGQYVRVAIVPDGYTRNTYGAQIAVGGKLESQEGNDGPAYRVVANDDNFTYFTGEDVVIVNTLASVPTIMLNIPVNTDS